LKPYISTLISYSSLYVCTFLQDSPYRKVFQRVFQRSHKSRTPRRSCRAAHGAKHLPL